MKHTMMYYGNQSYPVVHFPFNFDLVGLKTFPSPKAYDNLIKNWLDNMPAGGVANWVVRRENFFLLRLLKKHFRKADFINKNKFFVG